MENKEILENNEEEVFEHHDCANCMKDCASRHTEPALEIEEAQDDINSLNSSHTSDSFSDALSGGLASGGSELAQEEVTCAACTVNLDELEDGVETNSAVSAPALAATYEELKAQNIRNLDPDPKWYVLHTFSNYEVVAKDNLEKVIEKYNLQNRIFEILIPTEDAIVEKRNKKVIVANKTMPSYIFIKMIYGDDIWHTITRTHGVTGFVGPRGRPLPLSTKEVIAMKLERKLNYNVKLEVKDTVHVIDGPLAGQTAVITAVDAASGKITASVNMFGRPTSVELHTSQIKKV